MKRYAIISYEVNDGSGAPVETHRELVSEDVTVGELLAFLDNATHIPSRKLCFKHCLWWGDDTDGDV